MRLTPSIKQLLIVISLFGSGFGTYGLLAQMTGGNVLVEFGREQELAVSICRVIEESNLPMYVISDDLTISNMNKAALDFFSLEPDAIIGKDLEVLIQHVGTLVPEQWRSCIGAEQKEMIQRARAGRLPQAEAVIPMDLESDVNPTNRGKYVVWIRADRLYKEKDGEAFGSLVLFRSRKVSDWHDNELTALTDRCTRQDRTKYGTTKR